MARADEDLGPEYESTVAFYLIKHYGNMLKVSREKFSMHSLPLLRKFVAAHPHIVDEYVDAINEEIKGQGLEDNAVLRSLLAAQRERFLAADTKDSTAFASEIEKMVKEGKTDRIAGSTIEETVESHDSVQEMVEAILENPSEFDANQITKPVADAVRKILMKSFRDFSLWTFHIQLGFPFQEQDFHKVIFQTGQDIVDGKVDRVIVTIPPRHSKTQLMSICLPLYSFCHNESSHNIITSYADDVVQESSGYIRAIMTDPVFMKIFPRVRIDPAKRSLERWGTTRAGVMNAVPTGGKMTGKGAGLLAKKYSGCFVVDDVIKPKDAYSDAVRTEINDRYDNTFMSRLANDGVITEKGVNIPCPRTPMVIIMQRVHDSDLVGHILRGGSSDKYHYLNIPAVIEPDTGSADYYDRLIKKHEYTHAIPILYNLNRDSERSALWPSRKSLESLDAMLEANPYTYNSQYAGDPSAKGHGLVKEDWWQEYDPETFDYSSIQRSFITADTASTDKTYSDYNAFFHWGVTNDRRVICLDMFVKKLETPELIIEARKFWEKCNVIRMGAFGCIPTALYMEDKSTGQFLNQQFTREGNIRLLPVPRDKTSGNKIARFLNTIPYWSQGRFWFPAGHENLGHVQREILGMTSQGSGTGHDDCVDNVSDVVAIEFSGIQANYINWM